MVLVGEEAGLISDDLANETSTEVVAESATDTAVQGGTEVTDEGGAEATAEDASKATTPKPGPQKPADNLLPGLPASHRSPLVSFRRVESCRKT